jgi:uncharacterized membrane protein YqjE
MTGCLVGGNTLDIIQRLRSLAKILFVQLELHGKLAKVEWAEEKSRLQQLVIFGVIGFVCLLCALLFAGFFAVALSWDTNYRLVTIAGVFLFYSLVLGYSIYRMSVLAARGSMTFAATREEIAADLALIRSQL